MNILFFIFHFPPLSGGGVVVGVDLVNTLSELGHKVPVVTPDIKWTGPKYEPIINDSVRIIRVKVPFRNKIKLAARLCKNALYKRGHEIGKKEKFDFVFSIFHPFHLVSSAAVACASSLNIPSIIKIDDTMFVDTSGIKSIQRGIEKRINAKTLQKSSHILVVNKDIQSTVVQYYDVPESKISIMPNGTNLKFFRKRNPHGKTVIFSGVMYRHRGIDVLLKSAKSVIKTIPEVRFQLIGDGSEMKMLQQMVQDEQISDNVVFTGWIDRAKLSDELSGAQVGMSIRTIY